MPVPVPVPIPVPVRVLATSLRPAYTSDEVAEVLKVDLLQNLPGLGSTQWLGGGLVLGLRSRLPLGVEVGVDVGVAIAIGLGSGLPLGEVQVGQGWLYS